MLRIERIKIKQTLPLVRVPARPTAIVGAGEKAWNRPANAPAILLPLVLRLYHRAGHHAVRVARRNGERIGRRPRAIA